jgi:hypothetical protein
MSNSLSPEDLAWLRQCAAVDGNTYDRLLLHLLERVEALEAAQQQPHKVRLDRLIALDRDDDAPTPEAAPVATPTAPAGGLVEMVVAATWEAEELAGEEYERAAIARVAIREVADWLDLVGNKHSADELRREAAR